MDDRRKGIYRKYSVKRLFDRKHKHDSCFYFVLDTMHDRFALVALVAYAGACHAEYPQLSDEIMTLVRVKERK